MSNPVNVEPHRQSDESQFANEASRKAPSFLAEYWSFLRTNRKWWLLPILLALLVIGLVVVVGGTVAAPFIYTLF